MMEQDKYIRFDWAVKRLLRQKANFGVLEGFLTVLLNEKVTILELLESESNQQTAEDKFNRVDIKALNSKGGSAEHPRVVLPGTYSLWSGQSHHRTHFPGRPLLRSQKSLFC